MYTFLICDRFPPIHARNISPISSPGNQLSCAAALGAHRSVGGYLTNMISTLSSLGLSTTVRSGADYVIADDEQGYDQAESRVSVRNTGLDREHTGIARIIYNVYIVINATVTIYNSNYIST